MTSYQRQLLAVLSPAERQLFARLANPKKIQDFLDTLNINFESGGEIIIHSPREVLKRRRAHCIEGALVAATALAYHGEAPLLFDLRSTSDDFDHVMTLFKINNHWGAFSKTNYPVLRYRDPVYRTIRELAMSFFHEYYLSLPKGDKRNGKKTLREYSKPFDLRR